MMSDFYEYYLNNPHEIPEGDDDMYENYENEIENMADEDAFVYELLADEYVDFDVTKAILRSMFKAYCNRMHTTKQQDRDDADKDLLIFTKGLMGAMYEASFDILVKRNEK
jgi:hypothetical protein